MDTSIAVSLLLCVTAVAQGQVYLSLGGTNITTNNTEVLITDIGEDSATGLSTLTCNTDLTECCRVSDTGGEALGEWFYPNGSAILNNAGSLDAGEGFYRVRNAPQVIRLARRDGRNPLEPTGSYCCVIPSNTSEEVTFCTNIVVCLSLPSSGNGAISYSDPTLGVGTVATFSCDTGYFPNGEGVNRTCLSNGTWSGSTSACIDMDCGKLSDPVNGMVNFTLTTLGSTATYSCDTGYILNGMETRTCRIDGLWSPADEPTCLRDCGQLTSPTNGTVKTPGGTTEGMNATYTCDVGYNLVGNMTRTCQSEGQWSSSAPICLIIDCGPLTNPANGMVIFTTTTFQSTASYSCNTGYTSNGTATRTCGADGVWSQTQPTCSVVDCGSPPVVDNANVKFTSTIFLSSAAYNCHEGYTLNGGNPIVICQSNGTYTQPPVCTPVNCSNPPGILNGVVTVGNTTFGNSATYSCNAGFTLTGTENITCQADRTWSTSPTCRLLTPTISQAPAGYLLPGSSVAFGLSETSTDLFYQWTINGVNINDTVGRYEGTNTAVLTVFNLTDADNDVTVACMISDTTGQAVFTEPARILILPPPAFTALPVDTVVGVGQSTSFLCSATPLDGTITLRFETTAPSDRVIPSRSNTSVTLTVGNATVEDRGGYTCVASNARGTVRANATLSVVVVEDISDQTIPTGNTVTFTVMIDGAPSNSSIQYSWGETVAGLFLIDRFSPEIPDRVSGQDTRALTISNVAVGDGDQDYTCNVTVDGAMVGQTTAELTVITPVITEELPTATISLNATETLSLVCVGENPTGAVSTLFFSWAVRGNLLEDRDPRVNIVNTMISSNQWRSELTIMDMAVSDSGEYTCFVSNRSPFSETNSASSSTEVSVFSTPELIFVGSPYVFQAGANVTVICRVESIPEATSAELVEIVNGVEMVRDSGVRPSPFSLEQTITSSRHSRTFICQATNAFGNAMVRTTITVLGAPNSVDHTLIDSTPISLISMRIMLTPPGNNVPNNVPITGYHYILCQFTCASNSSLIAVNNFVVGDTVQFIIGGLVPNSEYILRVVAENGAGFGPIPDPANAYRFNSATSADGSPANLMVDSRFTTQNSLVLSWTLPSLGAQRDVTPTQYTIRWMREGGESRESIVPVDEDRTLIQGFVIPDLSAETEYSISVTTSYFTPQLTSDPATVISTTLSASESPGPLSFDQPTALTNTANELIITWTAIQVPFLSQYRVRFTVNSLIPLARGKRQTCEEAFTFNVTQPPFPVPNLQPFAEYSFNVDLEIVPLGFSSPVYYQAAPSVTIISSPQSPNAPTSPVAVPSGNSDPFRALDISWIHPSMPNGILVQCVVDFILPGNKGSTTVVPIGGLVPQGTTIDNLIPGTRYVFTVYCLSGSSIGEPGVAGASTASTVGTTLIGVFKPAVRVNNVDNSQRLITVDLAFSSAFGPHATYLLVISSHGNFSTDNVTALQSYPGMNGYYVTYAGVTGGSDNSISVSIGSGNTVSTGQDSYENVALELGTYSIFVRLFNLDGSLYNDSTIVMATIEVPTVLEPTIISVPGSTDEILGLSISIALITVLSTALLIILVVCLVVKARHLKDTRTQLSRLYHNQQQTRGTPNLYYEEMHMKDVGGTGDHTPSDLDKEQETS